MPLYYINWNHEEDLDAFVTAKTPLDALRMWVLNYEVEGIYPASVIAYSDERNFVSWVSHEHVRVYQVDTDGTEGIVPWSGHIIHATSGNRVALVAAVRMT